MKARYCIKCCRCGYEFSGKKGTPVVIDMIAENGDLYRLCENCITDIGRAETDEEQKKIIDEGKFIING